MTNRPLYFNSTSDIMEHRREYSPTIIADSIMVMNSYDEFDKMCQKAEQRLKLPPFWKDEEVEGGASGSMLVADKSQAIRFGIRPISSEASTCFIYGPTGAGKSCLMYSITAAYVSGQKPIIGKAWNVSGLSKYRYSKILYLDFESTQALIDRRKKRFIQPYLPTVLEDRQKCMDNLIIKCLKDDCTNYSEPVNHQKILDLITVSKDSGEKGQMPGLVVIDTYGNLVRSENPNSWVKVEQLIKKITILGISVIIVGHSSADGKRMEGFAKKIHACDSEIRLYRENANRTTLEAPMLVDGGKNRICETKVEKIPFSIYFDTKWKLYDPNVSDQADVDLKQAELQEFGITVKEYKDAGYNKSAIAEMLGYQKSAFYEKLRKYNACKEVRNEST